MASDSSFEKLRDLDLSRDEVERIGAALKQEEFRKLLVDYVEEIQDPENRKRYQEEITELEKQRGNDVVFINPEPGYVLKTSVDGTKKCFINICTSEHVKKPSSTPQVKDGARGLQWSLPHTLSPPREDLDNKGVRCMVYDVVFHPDTLRMAHTNKAFYKMLNNTACEAVEKNFNVKLDMKNVKFPKTQYKGLPHASIIKHRSADQQVPEMEPEEKQFYDKIYAQVDRQEQEQQEKYSGCKKTKKSTRKQDNGTNNKYTIPTYVIKHRSHVDIQEYLEDKGAKMSAAIPKELIVEINLPLLKSASDITLDVTEKTVQLSSENPSKYNLNLTLPYKVFQDNGNAKFDKDLKKLIITLPVKKTFMEYNLSGDSGVDSDHGSPTTTPSSESVEEFFVQDSELRTRVFLESSVPYNLPEFTSHLFEDTLAITLHVKNVDRSSICKILPSQDSFHVKFVSVSTSFYPSHFAFYVKLKNAVIPEDGLQVECWDNNVIIQVQFKSSTSEHLTHFYYGLSECDLKKEFIEEPSVLNTVLQEEVIPEENELSEETSPRNLEKGTSAINIAGGSSYESSGDELSQSYSPSKSRGILKRLSSSGRSLVERSISESSLDDFVYCSSLDSAIPEDGEMSTSLKKTVRFNDVIMRQLYRSNSSILGQKKKNQRKAKNKKRAQERRYSESEASEVDEKKDDYETGDSDNKNEIRRQTQKSDSNNDIFHMDMNFE